PGAAMAGGGYAAPGRCHGARQYPGQRTIDEWGGSLGPCSEYSLGWQWLSSRNLRARGHPRSHGGGIPTARYGTAPGDTRQWQSGAPGDSLRLSLRAGDYAPGGAV